MANGEVVTVAVTPGLCRRCVRRLSRRISDVPGVMFFEVHAARGLVVARGAVTAAQLRAALRAAGFAAPPPGPTR